MTFESREAQLEAIGNGTYTPATPGERYDERAAEKMVEWLNRFSPPASPE